MKPLFALFLAGCSLWTAGAQAPASWRIANPAIQVTLTANGALAIRQKASGIDWQSAVPSQPAAAVKQAATAPNSLHAGIEIDGVPLELKLSLAATEPELDLEISGPPETPLHRDLEYPFALRAPGGQYRMAVPHQTGLLFTLQDAATNRKFTSQYPTYSDNGLAMPWAGVTDLERGLMIVIDTPEGSGIWPRVESEVFAPQVYWQSSRGSLAYARKLHYRLFDRGGYVAMCKYYRTRLIRSGHFVTLRDKQKSRPQLSRLIGAVDLHMKGRDQDQMECVRYLDSHGVKRMLINSGAERETLDTMRQRGYLVGAYKIYTDIYPPGRPGSREETTRGYPQDGYTLKDGSPTRGFAYSDARKSTYRCSGLQLQLMKELVPPLVREKGYQALFLDVVTASAPRECYSPQHPLDRLQDLKNKIDILKFTAGLGLVVGSEDGAGWAAPYLEYFEGMAMPRRFGYTRVNTPTIGNWPQKFELDDEYRNVDLNEKVRAPLWDLVFHDSVVSTWRWNFTPDRYPDPKWWDKHDLFYLLGGDMPIFVVNRQHLDTYGERIAKTCKDVCDWTAKIGWDELVDHKDLTPDRSVQESRFSSGWAVKVDFAHGSYQINRW